MYIINLRKKKDWKMLMARKKSGNVEVKLISTCEFDN